MKQLKRFLPWIIYILGILIVFALATVALSLILAALLPVMGVWAVALLFIVSAALGSLLVYCAVMVGGWLADRGWFQ